MIPYFAASVFISLALGAFLLWRCGRERPASLLIAAAPVVFTLAAWFAVCQVFAAPVFIWNEVRLTPSFGLKFGYPLYPGPGEGPVNGHIYGPIPVLIYYAATIFNNPTPAIFFGTALTALMFALPPIVLVALRWPKGISRLAAASMAGFFLLASTSLSALWYVAFSIHVDVVALMFGALACAALISDLSEVKRYALASVLAMLGLWSKQVLLPLVALLPFLAAMLDGRAGFVRCTLVLLPSALLVSAALVLLFGPWQNIWYNLVTIPGGHPMTDGAGAFAIELALQCLLPLLICALPIISCLRASPRPPLREFARANRWIVFLAAGLASFPLSVMGRAKLGGDVNAYSYVLYFLYLAALLCIIDRIAALNELRGKARALVPIGALAVVTACGVSVHNYVRERDGHMYDYRISLTEQSFEQARTNPGRVYFASNPLSVLLAEGKLYHFDYGLFDRDLAGRMPTRAEFLAHVPPGARALVVRRSHINYAPAFYVCRLTMQMYHADIYEIIRLAGDAPGLKTRIGLRPASE